MALQFLTLDKEQDPALSESVYGHESNNSGPVLADGVGITEDGQRDGTVPRRLQSGNVYQLETRDPIKYALPDRDFLRLSSLMHHLLHAFKARPALQNLFRGPPPPSVTEEAVRSRRSQEAKNTSFWEAVTEWRWPRRPSTGMTSTTRGRDEMTRTTNIYGRCSSAASWMQVQVSSDQRGLLPRICQAICLRV